MLNYLKRARKSHTRLKFLNMMLIQMKLISPVMAMFTLCIRVGQQTNYILIVKDFVTLSFIMNLDILLAKNVPLALQENVNHLNSHGGLQFKVDENTYTKCYGRLKQAIRVRWRSTEKLTP
jgi:hypothetical protein